MSTRKSKQQRGSGTDTTETPTTTATTTATSSTPPHHRREWTHTLTDTDGTKESRLHRRENPSTESGIIIEVDKKATTTKKSKKKKTQDDEEEKQLAPSTIERSQLANQKSETTSLNPQPSPSTAVAAVMTNSHDDTQMQDIAAPAMTNGTSAVEEAASATSALATQLASFRSMMSTHQQPAFDYFTQIIGQIRATILTGETHISEYDGGSEVTVSTDLREMLHKIRIEFARIYPLSTQIWLEWIGDIQTIGSGLPPPTLPTSLDYEAGSAEAAEAAESATAVNEQHFLLSLFRIALTDYASPELWDAFLTYVITASERLLSSEQARISFRGLVAQGLWFRGWREERKKRASDRWRKKLAQKESEAEKKATKRKKDEEKKAEESETKEDDEMNESDESSEDEDDANDDEWSDNEDASVPESKTEDLYGDVLAASFNPFASFHPALSPLLPLPYSRMSPPSSNNLPSLIPFAYDFAHSDALFQKLRTIETKILTTMMRRLQRSQEAMDDGEDAEDVDQDAIEEQMERITRLYRIQLAIPMKDLESAYQSYSSWLTQQGENSQIDEELKLAYTTALETAQMITKKFELAASVLQSKSNLQAGVGTLTQEANDLFLRYIDFMTTSSRSKKRCTENPNSLFSLCETILSYAFLDVSWWHRYLSFLQQFGGSHLECVKHRLEVALRAHRNCPWDLEIIRTYFHQFEELQLLAPDAFTRSMMEEAFLQVFSNPAVSSNMEVNIEAQLLAIDYYRRTVLLSSSTVTREDALMIRAYFQSIRSLLPYLLQSHPKLPSRVYQYWIDLEVRYLHPHQGSLTDTEEQREDHIQSAEYAAQKQQVSITVYRARELWNEATLSFGATNSQIWMDWVTYESQFLIDPSIDHNAQITFIRKLFRRAIDIMTEPSIFSMTSSTSLSTLEPLLLQWLQFERLHSSTLAEFEAAQKRTGKYLSALKEVRDQEAKFGQVANQQSQLVEAEGEDAPSSWLTKPIEPKSNKSKTAQKPAPKPKSGEKKSKRTEKPATTKPPTSNEPIADGADKKSKKRKLTSDESTDQQPVQKKGKSEDGTAAAAVTPISTETSSTAMDTTSGGAPTTPAPTPPLPVPPHTIFICNLLWSLKESDHRTLLAPYGTITRLVSHRGSKAVKTSYVEVTYSNEEEVLSADKALSGKEISGKKLVVSRTSPNAPAPPATTDAKSQSILDEADPFSVFVKNLPRDRSDIESVVRTFFEEKCGKVTQVDIPRHANPSTATTTAAAASSSSVLSFKNFGTVRFESADSVPRALALNLQPLLDQIIGVVPNTAPAREKRAKAEAEKKKAAANANAKKLTAFQPRSTMVKLAPTSATSSAPLPSAAPIQSNEDFRAKLFGKK